MQVGEEGGEDVLASGTERVGSLRDDAVVDDAREGDHARLVGGAVTETAGVGPGAPRLPVPGEIDHVRSTAITDERRVRERHARLRRSAHPNPAVAAVRRRAEVWTRPRPSP